MYLLTDRGAPNKKVVAVPIDRPDAANWKTIVPESRNAIDSARLIAGKLAVNALVDVASEVRFYNLDGSPAGQIAPPGLGTIAAVAAASTAGDLLHIHLAALSVDGLPLRHGGRPEHAVRGAEADLRSGALHDRARLRHLEGRHARADVHHAPQGSEEGRRQSDDALRLRRLRHSELPRFRPEVPAILERGGVWVTANMRGGGEYGEAWHEAGMFEKKQNVFDDFIAAAEYLVKERYASPQTLGIMGGSNGGLLVGAVQQQRPDLFAVALPAVGVMDMLRYHRFTGGAAWATEYGSAENAKDFAYLYKYSPLHNVVTGKCYPRRWSRPPITTTGSCRATRSSSPRRCRRRRDAGSPS
jgi:prolyl oligopeptidase